jgi:hypothetical protein
LRGCIYKLKLRCYLYFTLLVPVQFLELFSGITCTSTTYPSLWATFISTHTSKQHVVYPSITTSRATNQETTFGVRRMPPMQSQMPRWHSVLTLFIQRTVLSLRIPESCGQTKRQQKQENTRTSTANERCLDGANLSWEWIRH